MNDSELFDYHEEMKRNLDHCSFFLPVFSKSSFEQPARIPWAIARMRAESSVDDTLFIVPIALDLDGWYLAIHEFRNFQCIQLYGERDQPQLIAYIVDLVEKYRTRKKILNRGPT
jgi:hypothetical protein